MKVLKRHGRWHWWCNDCMGGNWEDNNGTPYTWEDALVSAWAHLWVRHSNLGSSELWKQLRGIRS